VTACGASSRRSKRRYESGCTSRSPSRGAGWRRLSEAISPITPCRPTRHRSEHSAITWSTSGAARCRDAVSTVGSPGSGSSRSLMTGSLRRESFFRGRSSALPSDTQGRSRMPELGTYGSVRGAAGNSRPANAGMPRLSTRSDGRRPKSAKVRNRGWRARRGPEAARDSRDVVGRACIRLTDHPHELPMRMPARNTSTPPMMTWNAAVRNGVSI
jgi:hypothetical protein